MQECPRYPYDFTVASHGTVVTFEAHTEQAKEFVQHHVHVEPWQWCGSAGVTRFACDHRPAASLLQALQDDFCVEVC